MSMATIAVRRKRTTFHFHPELLERLKQEAKASEQSLNGFVEEILWDAVYDEPNEVTKAAIEESLEGKYAGTIDLSSREAFLKSMGL